MAEIGPDGEVVVHEWLKRAILLLFQLRGITTEHAGPFEFADRLPLKPSTPPPACASCPAALRAGGATSRPA